MMDPVTLDICWSRLVGVVTEQAAALMRTSFTSIVREAGDLSAGVFDRRGFMVAQAVTGTPGHINSMALAMKHFLAACPVETIVPGDVLITNRPLEDLRASERCHDLHAGVPGRRLRRLLRVDVPLGGHRRTRPVRGGPRGVRGRALIPIMKLYEGGQLNRALDALIGPDTRVPDLVIGDFHAQIAGAPWAPSASSNSWTSSASSVSSPSPTRSSSAQSAPCARRSGAFGRRLRVRHHVGRLRPADHHRMSRRGAGRRARGGLCRLLTREPPRDQRGDELHRGLTTYGVKVIVSPEVPNNEGAFRPIRISAPPAASSTRGIPLPSPRAT